MNWRCKGVDDVFVGKLAGRRRANFSVKGLSTRTEADLCKLLGKPRCVCRRARPLLDILCVSLSLRPVLEVGIQVFN